MGAGTKEESTQTATARDERRDGIRDGQGDCVMPKGRTDMKI